MEQSWQFSSANNFLSTNHFIVFSKVAEFKPPISEVGGNMQQGLYIPKACVWEELYDPIHVLLRAVQNKKDFQNSTDRFTA